MLLLSILNSNPCQSSLFLKILLLVENLVNLICVVVPIGLIIITAVDLFKNVTGNEDTMKKNNKTIIQRIILCILIFLVPSFVNLTMYIINSALGDDTISLASCYGNISLEDIKVAEANEELEKEYYDEPDTKVYTYYTCTYQTSSSNGYDVVLGKDKNGKIYYEFTPMATATDLPTYEIMNFDTSHGYYATDGSYNTIEKWYKDSYFINGICPSNILIATGYYYQGNGSWSGGYYKDAYSFVFLSNDSEELKEATEKLKYTSIKVDKEPYFIEKITTYSQTGNTAENRINENSSSLTTTGKVTYYNQADSAWATHGLCPGSSKTIKSSGCGPTSLAMMASTFGVYSTTPITMVDWLCDNGHTNGALPKSFFTNSSLLSHFKIKGELLFDNGNNQGNAGKTYSSSDGGKILNAVQSGKGVIIYIPGHYLAVGPNPSCSSEQVYIYDSGSRSFSGCMSPQELFEKTYNRSNRCTDKGNCGWKAAWAYSSAN